MRDPTTGQLCEVVKSGMADHKDGKGRPVRYAFVVLGKRVTEDPK